MHARDQIVRGVKIPEVHLIGPNLSDGIYNIVEKDGRLIKVAHVQLGATQQYSCACGLGLCATGTYAYSMTMATPFAMAKTLTEGTRLADARLILEGQFSK